MLGNASPISGATLASKPSSSFSSKSTRTTTSARSAPRKLLFGEIDPTDTKTYPKYHSPCALFVTSSRAFFDLWLSEPCREALLNHLSRQDMGKLRMVCSAFNMHTSPHLFEDIGCTFKTSSLTKPARLVGLQRISQYVETFSLSLPYSSDNVLPPLLDSDGKEKHFVFSPEVQAPSTVLEKIKQPKYGDWVTNDLIGRQYPSLFHAATNTTSFLQAFSMLTHLTSLTLTRSEGDYVPNRGDRSIADFALMSLRSALEQARLPSLVGLTIEDVHVGALSHLTPPQYYGQTPASSRAWSAILDLEIELRRPGPTNDGRGGTEEQLSIVREFLRCFTRLERLRFGWSGRKGPFPLPKDRPKILRSTSQRQPRTPQISPNSSPNRHRDDTHPAFRIPDEQNTSVDTVLPCLTDLELYNTRTSIDHVKHFIGAHRTIGDMTFEPSVVLTSGTWEELATPGGSVTRESETKHESVEVGEVIIMFDSSPESSPVSRTLPKTALVDMWSGILPQTPSISRAASPAVHVRMTPSLMPSPLAPQINLPRPPFMDMLINEPFSKLQYPTILPDPEPRSIVRKETAPNLTRMDSGIEVATSGHHHGTRRRKASDAQDSPPSSLRKPSVRSLDGHSGRHRQEGAVKKHCRFDLPGATTPAPATPVMSCKMTLPEFEARRAQNKKKRDGFWRMGRIKRLLRGAHLRWP